MMWFCIKCIYRFIHVIWYSQVPIGASILTFLKMHAALNDVSNRCNCLQCGSKMSYNEAINKVGESKFKKKHKLNINVYSPVFLRDVIRSVLSVVRVCKFLFQPWTHNIRNTLGDDPCTHGCFLSNGMHFFKGKVYSKHFFNNWGWIFTSKFKKKSL